MHQRKNTKIHRDLKPENLFMASINLKKLKVKIADFGLSNCRVQWYDNVSRFSTPGTLNYAAPELFTSKTHD